MSYKSSDIKVQVSFHKDNVTTTTKTTTMLLNNNNKNNNNNEITVKTLKYYLL